MTRFLSIYVAAAIVFDRELNGVDPGKSRFQARWGVRAGVRYTESELRSLLRRMSTVLGANLDDDASARKLPGGELAGLYIDSFEQVWETATPVDGA